MNPSLPLSFNNVRYGRFRSPCSPQFGESEPDGIKIAAPATFEMTSQGNAQPSLPLCVSLRFNAYVFTKFDHVIKALKVVIVDDDNGQVLSGGIWRDRHFIPHPPPTVPREELEKRRAWEYASVNLLQIFTLPSHNARYHVYAMLEEHKSNVVTIDVVSK